MSAWTLGRGKWVFVDWMGIWPGYGKDQQGRDLPFGFLVPHGIEIRAHSPRVEDEPVLFPEHPWEPRGVHAFSTFVEDGGVFRCWYHVPLQNDVGLAYAESQDGVRWNKPVLNLQDFNGSSRNNLVRLISRGGVEQTHHVFIDPSAPPSERYKMVSSCEDRDLCGIYGAVSPDGLQWEHLVGDPVILRNRCDTHNIGSYDASTGKYRIFTRQADQTTGRRGINLAESTDFRSFPDSARLLESTPLDPPDWDYYTSGYSPWPGAADAHLLRFSVYHRTLDTVDVHLATSRDVRIWHRPMGGQAWIAPSPDGSLPYQAMYGCAGILRTARGEWSSYVGVYPESHNDKGPRTPGKILRAVSREDGVVSLHAPGKGEFVTMDFPLEAEEILLNVRTGPSGFVRCSVLAADGGGGAETVRSERHPVPVHAGFSIEDCAVISGDHFAVPLVWRKHLGCLHGKSVQLHFELVEADLFAVTFGLQAAHG